MRTTTNTNPVTDTVSGQTTIDATPPAPVAAPDPATAAALFATWSGDPLVLIDSPAAGRFVSDPSRCGRAPGHRRRPSGGSSGLSGPSAAGENTGQRGLLRRGDPQVVPGLDLDLAGGVGTPETAVRG